MATQTKATQTRARATQRHHIGEAEVDWARGAARRSASHPAWARHRDEFEGVALLELARVASLDAPESFRAFAWVAIRRAIRRAKRAVIRRGLREVPSECCPRVASLDAPAGLPDSSAPLGDLLSLDARGGARKPSGGADLDSAPQLGQEEVRAAVKSLPRPHQGVICQRYGLMTCLGSPRPVESIATLRKWPVEKVRRIEAEALAMLRERLAGLGAESARESA